MIRKLMICPWFGPLPTWYRLWFDNISRLGEHGYDVYVTQDQHDFNARVARELNIANAIQDDGRKVCDYRCAFGLLYADLLDGYDFWGHTDLDMVYGRVERYVTDDFLDGLDLHSNHPTYVSGPWTLYRNTDFVNRLFMIADDWLGQLENPVTSGWVEKEYSAVVEYAADEGSLRRTFTNWQTKNLDNFDRLHWDGDALMEGREEVMVAHFRRTKEYPRSLL